MLLLLLAAASVSACASSPPSHAIVVDTAPPAPLVEVIPEPAGPDYVWINGYWAYNGFSYVWVRGHWTARPYDDWGWSRSGWVYVDGRYRFVAGTWVPNSRPRTVIYVHPAPEYRRGPVYRTIPRRPAPRGRPRR